MQLCLVRHGQTDWNVADRIQGQTDIPLNDTGIKQAESMRDQICQQDLQFDAIYSAPLQRTRKTAEIIADGQDIIYSDLLKERSTGEFEGAPSGTLYNHEIDFLDLELNSGAYGVEPILDFEGRVKEFIEFLRSNHVPDAKILAVTSNGFMKRLAILTTGVSDKEVPSFKNATLYEFTI